MANSKLFSNLKALANEYTHLSTETNVPNPMVLKFKKDEKPPIEINIPFVSAIMQSVSDSNLAIALSKCGGLSFIFGSQSIAQQVEMVKKVKNFKF